MERVSHLIVATAISDYILSGFDRNLIKRNYWEMAVYMDLKSIALNLPKKRQRQSLQC